MKRLLIYLFISFAIHLAAQAQITATMTVTGQIAGKTTNWVGSLRYNRLLINVVNPSLQPYNAIMTSKFYSSNGTLLAESVNENQQVISLSSGSNIIDFVDLYPDNSAIYFKIYATDLSNNLSSGFIPEDEYQICIDLIDISTQKTLLNAPVCRNVPMVIYQAPVLMQPVNNQELKANSLPILRWLGVSPNPAFIVKYNVKLYEIVDGQTPEIAVRSNFPYINETVIGQSQFIWSASYELPKAGKKYVWTVQALDINDRPVGEPNGTATPFAFSVGGATLSADITENQEDKSALAIYAKNKITKKAIPNATIKVKNSIQLTDLSQSTDGEGAIVIENLASDDYEVSAESQGYVSNKATITIDKTTQRHTIYLEPKKGSLKGVIVSAHNKQALQGVTVQLFSKLLPSNSLASVLTDKNGAFAFPDINPLDNYFLKTQLELYQDYTSETFEVKPEENKNLETLVIGNTKMGIMYGSIKGKLTYADGDFATNKERKAGQKIYLLTPADFRNYGNQGVLNGIKPAIDLEKGDYIFTEVPVLPKGEQGYVVLVNENNFYESASISSVKIFQQDEEKTADLEVAASLTKFIGVITDTQNNPIRGVKVEIYDKNERLSYANLTNEKGEYFIGNAPLATYGAMVLSKSDFATKEIKALFDTPKKIQKNDIQLIAALDISGIVKNQFGEVLKGAKIMIEGIAAESDEKGIFFIKGTSTTRTKKANVSYKNNSFNITFEVPVGTAYILPINIVEPKKRLIINVVDSKSNFIPNFTLTATLISKEEAIAKNKATTGRVFYTQTFTSNNGNLPITFDMPEGYQEQGVRISASLSKLTPAYYFFTIPQKPTIFFKEASTQITLAVIPTVTISGTITDATDNTTKLAGVKVSYSTKTVYANSEGKYILEGLAPAENYQLTFTKSGYDSKVITPKNSKSGSLENVSILLPIKMTSKEVIIASIKKIFGFDVEIETATQTKENTKVYFLKGKFTNIPEQTLQLKDAEAGISFKNLYYNIETKKVVNENNQEKTSFWLQNANIPLLLNEEIEIMMNKPTVSSGLIASSNFTIESLKSDDDNNTINLSNIRLIPKAGTSIGLQNIENTVSPSFVIDKVGEDDDLSFAKNIGDYAFTTKSEGTPITLSKDKVSKNYQFVMEGGFSFTNSPYDDEGSISIKLSDFNVEDNSGAVEVAGEAGMGKKPILLVGTIGFDDNFQMKMSAPLLYFRTGLISAPLNAESEGSFTIDKNGKMTDFILKLSGEADTLRGGVRDPNIKLKATATTTTTAKVAPRKFFGGEYTLESIVVSTDQTAVLTASIKGDIRFELFSVPISIEEFTINSDGVVKLVAKKQKANFTSPMSTPSGGKAATTTTNPATTTATATKTTATAKAATGSTAFSLDISSVTAFINLYTISNSTFILEGSLALGTDRFKVNVDKIVIGQKTWGGSLGVKAGSDKWALALSGMYVYAKEDAGDFKKGHNFGAAGSLWIGKDGTTSSQTKTTTSSTTPKSDINATTEIAAAFAYFDAKNWSVSFSMSKEVKTSTVDSKGNITPAATTTVSTKSPSGGFKLTKLGGGFARQEIASTADPSQTIDAWTITGELGMQKGEELSVEAEFSVLTGNEVAMRFMGKMSYESSSGTKVGGNCDISLNFTQQIYQGAVAIAIETTSTKIEGSASFYLNIPKDQFALGLTAKFPFWLYPQVDVEVKVYVGNAIKQVYAESLVSKGFYVQAGFAKDWSFEKTYLGTGVNAKASFAIYLGLGLDFSLKAATGVVTLGGEIKASAKLTIVGFEIASVSASAGFTLTGTFSKELLTISGNFYFKLEAQVNCGGCECGGVKTEKVKVNMPSGIPFYSIEVETDVERGYRKCIDVGLTFEGKRSKAESSFEFSTKSD